MFEHSKSELKDQIAAHPCELRTSVGGEYKECTINSVVYLYSAMQYIVVCLCYSISKPFRKPIWTNPFYLVSVIIMSVYNIYLLSPLSNGDTISTDIFKLIELPKSFKNKMLLVTLVNSLISYIFEKFFIGWFNKFWNNRTNKKK